MPSSTFEVIGSGHLTNPAQATNALSANVRVTERLG